LVVSAEVAITHGNCKQKAELRSIFRLAVLGIHNWNAFPKAKNGRQSSVVLMSEANGNAKKIQEERLENGIRKTFALPGDLPDV
jgi:hypothetical protein